MNCKPGDLAVIVRSVCGNEGKIVRCIRALGVMRFVGPAPTFRSMTWYVEPSVLDAAGTYGHDVPDCCLRPLRPGDITDEEVRDLYAPKLPEHV